MCWSNINFCSQLTVDTAYFFKTKIINVLICNKGVTTPVCVIHNGIKWLINPLPKQHSWCTPRKSQQKTNNAWELFQDNISFKIQGDKITQKSNRFRAVKMFLSSRLIMNSRRLWNSHQRHKFLRAEASRDILKLRVSEMAFPGVFKRHFPEQKPCYFVTIIARLGTMPSKCSSCSSTSHGSNVSQI